MFKISSTEMIMWYGAFLESMRIVKERSIGFINWVDYVNWVSKALGTL